MGFLINSYLPFQALITSGIKIYFSFEESSGNIVNQALSASGFPNGLGNASDGVASGDPTYSQTGKIDDAISYDGAGDFFTLGSDKSNFKFLNNGSNFTIAFWLKRNDTANELQGIFGTGEGGSTIGMVVRLDGTNNQLEMKIEDGTGESSYIFSSNNYVPNNTTTYYYYIITFDGSNGTWNIYKDNANNESNTADLDWSTANPTNLPRVGDELDTGGINELNGLLDELVVFDRIITSAERTYLYNSGSGQLIS